MLARWLFVLVLIGAALTGRVISEGQTELTASDRAFDRGDLRHALEHARRSATLYAPGATHVDRAYQRLLAVAVGAEASGDSKIAYLAWQDVRSAALESRHVWLPRAAELERANRNLSRLEALSRGATDGDRAAAEERAQSSLNEDNAPAPRWIALLGAGFFLTLAGLAVFAFQGMERSGTFALTRARIGGTLFVIGVACWTWAAYRA